MKPSRKKKAFADPQGLASTPQQSKCCSVHVEERLDQLRHLYEQAGSFSTQSKSASTIQVFDAEFGQGLDFLLSWQLLQQRREQGFDTQLVYVALSEQPLSPEHLAQVYQADSALKSLSNALLEQYPLPIKGYHQLDFDCIKLILIQAPSEETVGQIQGQFDVFVKPTEVKPELVTTYVAPWQRPVKPLEYGSSVAVVGGGISGTSTAYSLSKKGYKVTIIERGETLAVGASGNRQGMLYAKLPDNPTVAGQFHQQGLQHSMALLKRTLGGDYWQSCGLLQLAKSEKEDQQMQAVIARQYPASWLQKLTQQQAEDLAQQPLSAGGLFFPHSGWVSPAHWCQALFEQSGADLWCNSQVVSLEQVNEGWQVSIASPLPGQCQGQGQSQHQFDAVVLANANAAQELLPNYPLGLNVIRGQVSYVSPDQAPQVVVCGEGYVTPRQGNTMAVGASYNLRSEDAALNEKDHTDNLQRLQDVLPNAEFSPVVAGGRVGFRAVTPDYLPMVGQVADEKLFLERFAKLRQDANYKIEAEVPYLKGLYVNVGHGSKGLIAAPLSAEILASQMANHALPVAQCVAFGLDPNRFIIRDLIRRKR